MTIYRLYYHYRLLLIFTSMVILDLYYHSIIIFLPNLAASFIWLVSFFNFPHELSAFIVFITDLLFWKLGELWPHELYGNH